MPDGIIKHVLKKLKDKASRAFTQARTAPTAFNVPYSADDDVEEDLALFGGQTKVLRRKRTDSQPSASSPYDSSNSPCLDISGTGMGIHPSLSQYLSSLPDPSSRTSLLSSQGEISQFTRTNQPQRYGVPYPEFQPAQITIPEYETPAAPSSYADQAVPETAALGLDFRSASVTDEHWLSFMRQSGILDGTQQIVDKEIRWRGYGDPSRTAESIWQGN